MGLFDKLKDQFISGGDLLRNFSGQTGAEASLRGAELQNEAILEGIDLQRETRDLVRSDLAPFRDLGEGQIPRLLQLLDDPRGDPTFDAFLEHYDDMTLKNAAARGRLSSGDTRDAFANNFLRASIPIRNQIIA